MPLVGHVDTVTRTGVSGWAVNADAPGSPAALTVLVDGTPCASGLADQPRPGLSAGTKGLATDHAGFRFAFDPPLSPLRDWRIEVVQTGTDTALPGGARVLPRPARDGGGLLSPILVTATGGEAITRLLADLARHPAIVAADRPPYDTRQIAYFAQTLATLTAPAGPARRAPDTVLAPRPAATLGANPLHTDAGHDLARPAALLHDFHDRHVPGRYTALFADLIAEFYGRLRLSQGKAPARYFAERGDLDETARLGARLFFATVREIVVVRDPRDLLAAAIATWKLPAEEAAAALRQTVARLAAIRAAPAADTLILRHEDLILDPAGTWRTIGRFLDIDPRMPDAAVATGAEPAASIGRWRQDLSLEQIDACEAAFDEFMAAFDYRRAADGGGAAAGPAPRPIQTAAEAVAEAVVRAAVAAADPAPGPAPTQAKPSLVSPLGRPGGLLVAADGNDAVAALRAASIDQTADGRPMKPVARLEFGRGNAGAAQLGPGWSRPEPGYVWSNARQSHVALPPLREPGSYRVWIAGAPLLHPENLPEQPVTVLVNTVEVGTVVLRALSVMAFDLPVPATAAGGKIALTLRLPKAARPCDLGPSTDDRLLGFSLRWATVLRAEPAAETGLA